MEGVGELDAEGLFEGPTPQWRERYAVGVLGLVPQVGVALATAGGVATLVPPVRVRLGGQGGAEQPELLANLLEVGQVQDVLNGGEVGIGGTVGLAQEPLVVADGLGLAGDEKLDVVDEGGDPASHASEVGFAGMYRIYRMT